MAGGGAPQPTSAGGKKSVDFQINLIPMIDLLSVLISFLLMTFVWTQIVKIDVK
jgi:biopolymer transport protein ExbD